MSVFVGLCIDQRNFMREKVRSGNQYKNIMMIEMKFLSWDQWKALMPKRLPNLKHKRRNGKKENALLYIDLYLKKLFH